MDPSALDGLLRRSLSHHLRVLSFDHRTVLTRHEFRLEAHRETRFFQRKYTWTGTGIENRPVVDPNPDGVGHATHKLQGPVVTAAGNTRLMLVDLGRNLLPKDEVALGVSHRFVDTGGTFNRHLGAQAFEGCGHIELAVTLPAGNWDVEGFTQDERNGVHTGRTRDLVKEERTDGRADVVDFRWKVEDVLPGKFYTISWKALNHNNGRKDLSGYRVSSKRVIARA